MEAEIKNLSSSEIEITTDLPAADFEKAYIRTLERHNKKLQLPGFRPGHIPENIVREKIGESSLLQEAAEETIQKWYKAFLAEKKIEAIGSPQVSITKMARNNPLGVKLVTATLPQLELPDYKAIAREVMQKKEEIVVEDKEIDDTLEHLRKSKMKSRQAKNAKDNAGSGDAKPEKEVKEITLDDEFAKSFGNFNTLVELREVVRTNLTLEKETKKKEEKRMEILERVAAKVNVDIPEIMMTSEKNKMIGELKSSMENMGMKWNDYLTHVKKTEEEIKKGWDEQARKRVLFGLILRTITLKEYVKIDEKELDALVENLKNQYGYDNTDGHAMEHLRDYAYGILKNEKIFQLLEKGEDKEDKKE